MLKGALSAGFGRRSMDSGLHWKKHLLFSHPTLESTEVPEPVSCDDGYSMTKSPGILVGSVWCLCWVFTILKAFTARGCDKAAIYFLSSYRFYIRLGDAQSRWRKRALAAADG